MTSTTDTRSLERALFAGFAPPPATTIDTWAEAFRYLPTETSADAGMWRNAKTPWAVEVMRALSPSSPAREVVVMFSARTTKTEAINNTVGFYMDAVKCPIMVAQPIEADAEEWSKDHLDPMISHTPALSSLITPDKDRRKGNTILHKKYRGGVVYVVGANSSKSFRRRTVRVLLCDELDAWPGTIDGEGDPYTLAKERTSTFPFSKKILAASTPTIKGSSRIEAAFLSGDQRYFHVPCPECGRYQRLVFSRLHYSADVVGTDGKPIADYECEACGILIPQYRRDGMVARGRWVPTFLGRAVWSYQISQLYSPWVSWSDLAAAWLASEKDQLQRQVFVNTKLGETYDVAEGDTWDPDSLMRLRVSLDVLPARVVVLTASVDTQADRLVLQVDAWGPGEERWTLDRFDLVGDPTKDPSDPTSVWAELDQHLLTLSYPTERATSLRIRACGVDTGGHATAQAYKFCRARRSRRVWAVKGDVGREGSKLWPQVPSRKNKGNLPLHMLGIFAGKESCMARLRASAAAIGRGERGGPGFWHFAAREALGVSYFDELTSEVCVVDTARARGGRATGERRRRWQLRRSDLRNEALDCSVYSYAVLHGLMAQGLRLDRGRAETVTERVDTTTPAPSQPAISSSKTTSPNLDKIPSAQTPVVSAPPTPIRKRPRWEAPTRPRW